MPFFAGRTPGCAGGCEGEGDTDPLYAGAKETKRLRNGFWFLVF